MNWKLADAKNRFSELVNLALTQGAQRVQRRQDAVVVISAKEYDQLRNRQTSFKEFLLQGESFEGVNLTRDKSKTREVRL